MLPTEDEFDILQTALVELEKSQVATLCVKKMFDPKAMEGELSDEDAFVAAFNNKEVLNTPEVRAELKAISDKTVVLKAKLIQLRDHIRQRGEAFAIDELIKPAA